MRNNKRVSERKPLAANTIKSIVTVVKLIRGSVVNDDGNQVYPYVWNQKFIDAPKIRKKDMKRPTLSPKIMNGLARLSNIFYRVLFILMAATGARIGEMLALEIDKHISPDYRTISIEQKVLGGIVEDQLKTEASWRKVDLHPAISAILKWFVGSRKSGFLFPGKWVDRPVCYQTVLEHLHRALEELGYENDYDQSSDAGTHIFRRYRITYLKNFTSCKDGVRMFWLGHAADDDDKVDEKRDVMGDWYDTIAKNRPFRLQVAEAAGFGFELPSDVPNAPKFPSCKRSGRKPRNASKIKRIDKCREGK
jgi:integrase